MDTISLTSRESWEADGGEAGSEGLASVRRIGRRDLQRVFGSAIAGPTR